VNTVGKMLFHPILLQKVQTHFRRIGTYVIGMDDQLSVGPTDLSFALFRQWNKYIGNVLVSVEFDPL
jgi:hypothetical protein